MSLLVLDTVTVSFGARDIFADLSLRIGQSDRIGLIGPNGSGKTTFLRLLAGHQEADKGTIETRRGLRIGYLAQDLTIDSGKPLIDFVLSSVPGRDTLFAELRETETKLAASESSANEAQLLHLAEQISDIHERIAHFETFYAEHRALQILAGLGFATSDRHRGLGEFSGGWRMRAVLASLLFQRPDLLLLDEPTNHLDMPSIAWLSGFLVSYPKAFILISHDREFLNEQISRVVSFEPEGVRQYTGNYEQYRVLRREEELVLANRARNVTKQREHMERFVERFRAKATKARAAQSRLKALEKLEVVEHHEGPRQLRFRLPPAIRCAQQVISIDQIDKSFNQHKVLSDVSLSVQRGEKIAILGENGAGKTTLLKLIASELKPNRGTITIGSKVTLGYYAQHHADQLRAERTVYEELSAANTDASPAQVRSILGAFLFSGDDVDKKIAILSGGERARVALARLMIRPANLLMMDEPSNHLDLESSESLAESLAVYDGTLVFVSHNRSLIRKLATRIWNVEDGKVETYPGTLDEYMDSSRRRREASTQPETATQTTQTTLPPTQRGQHTRAERQARKKREAKLRQQRKSRIGPIEEKIGSLEARIETLESEQSNRSAQLADPQVYNDMTKRNRLLREFQRAAQRIDELTTRWEHAAEELQTAQAEFADNPD